MVCFGGLSPRWRSTWILADLLFFENVTSGPVAGAVGLAVVPAAAGLGLGVPNASVFTWSGGTPSSVSMALVASIIDGGPHRWILREARSGTSLREQFLRDASARALPVCPFRFEHRDRDVQLRIRALKRGDLVRKNEVGRSAARSR